MILPPGGGGGGTVILKPPGSFIAGGGIGSNRLVGRGGNAMLPFVRRRKFPDQITPTQGRPNSAYPSNPYADILGYQTWEPGWMKGQTYAHANQQHLMAPGDPWAGYPSHDQVQRMSDAITAWSGVPLNPLRQRSGLGTDVGDPTDLLKRLLRERYSIGGGA